MAETYRMDDYKKLVEERVQEEESRKKPPEKPSGGDEPPLDFVEQCLDGNEVGDSLLYNRLFKGKFVNNVIMKDGWMQFDGNIWQQDYHKKAKASVEAVVEQYLRLLEKIDGDISEHQGSDDMGYLVRGLRAQKKKLLTRVNKLRSDKGRNAVLSCAVSNADPLTVTTRMFDNNPMLFPCANGVIDLKTGNFREGRPEDYMTMDSPVQWKGMDSPRENFERFLVEIFNGDQDVIDYLQRVLGYTITGLKNERLFCVFYGPHGQNGKGTLMDILYAVMGQMAGPIQTELLMSQKFARSSSGPSPDVMALKGRRLAWASETERYNSFASGKIKLYSGGDALVGRNLNDREQTTFWPTHVLFLLCNKLPKAPPEDSAFWERMRVFLFQWSYVNNPTEPYQRPVYRNLIDKILLELPGVLAWLVEGCLKWQQQGLSPPEKIIEDSNKYREHEDDIQDFLDECCLVDKTNTDITNRTTANDLYQRFKTWWQSRNSYKCMPQKEFSDILQLKGFTKIKSDKIFYQFIRLIFNFDDKNPPPPERYNG